MSIEFTEGENIAEHLDPAWIDFFARDGLSDPLWHEQGLDRRHLDRLYAYAYHLYQIECYYGAKEILFLLISLELHNFDYHVAMGLCWHKLNCHNDALFHFLIACAQKLEDPTPMYFAGLSFELLQEPALAISFFEGALICALSYPDMDLLRQEVQQRLAGLRGQTVEE